MIETDFSSLTIGVGSSEADKAEYKISDLKQLCRSYGGSQASFDITLRQCYTLQPEETHLLLIDVTLDDSKDWRVIDSAPLLAIREHRQPSPPALDEEGAPCLTTVAMISEGNREVWGKVRFQEDGRIDVHEVTWSRVLRKEHKRRQEEDRVKLPSLQVKRPKYNAEEEAKASNIMAQLVASVSQPREAVEKKAFLMPPAVPSPEAFAVAPDLGELEPLFRSWWQASCSLPLTRRLCDLYVSSWTLDDYHQMQTITPAVAAGFRRRAELVDQLMDQYLGMYVQKFHKIS